MKISTRARYGLRVIVELARRHGTWPVTARELASGQALSQKYIERLIALMRGAGLVRAARGVYGGYVLARDPREVSVLEVFSLLEGPGAVVDCLDGQSCPRQRRCPTRGVWEDVDRAIRRTLGARSIAELAERGRQRSEAEIPVFQA